ncbi:MAG: hypothetical protein EXR11_04045 [Rhodospirillaceae bacterium]|nr:hypothetical protein [Rhodospirillaceae bacterium]
MTATRQDRPQDIETTLADFAYTETSVGVVTKNLRDRLFQRLTQKSANLFLRGSDLISVGPQVRQTPWKKNWPVLAKALALPVTPRITTHIVCDVSNDWTGDIILAVSA